MFVKGLSIEMPKFNYVAIDSKGKTVTDSITGSDSKEVRNKIRLKGLTPIQIKSSGASPIKKEKAKSKKIGKLQSGVTENKKPLRGKGEKLGLEFLKRLLELHSSGMPVADAVKLLNQRLSDPGQKEIAGILWKELAEENLIQSNA